MGTIDAIRGDANYGGPVSRSEGRRGLPLTMVMQKLAAMLERHRTRRILLGLTDEQLKDIGISRADAEGEGYRPFWD